MVFWQGMCQPPRDRQSRESVSSMSSSFSVQAGPLNPKGEYHLREDIDILDLDPTVTSAMAREFLARLSNGTGQISKASKTGRGWWRESVKGPYSKKVIECRSRCEKSVPVESRSLVKLIHRYIHPRPRLFADGHITSRVRLETPLTFETAQEKVMQLDPRPYPRYNQMAGPMAGSIVCRDVVRQKKDRSVKSDKQRPASRAS